MRNRAFYIILALWLCSATLMSQESRERLFQKSIVTHKFVPEKSNVVFAHLIQPNGPSWLATQNGLFRYDGHQWVSFHSKESAQFQIHKDYVHSLAYIKEKNEVWAGTLNGIAVIDAFSGRQIDTLLSENTYHHLIAYDKYVFANIDGPTFSKIQILSTKGELLFDFSDKAGESFLSLKNGDFFQVYSDSLYYYSLDQNNSVVTFDVQKIDYPKGFNSKNLSGYYQDNEILLHRGSSLYLWNFITKELNVIYSNKELSAWESTIVNPIMSDGSFWLFGEVKLWYLNKIDDEFIGYQITDNTDLKWINQAKFPLSVYMDSKNVIWVSDAQEGLIAIDTKQLVFKNFIASSYNEWLENDENVWSLSWSDDKKDVVFTTNRGAYHVQFSSSFDSLGEWDPAESIVTKLKKLPLNDPKSFVVDVVFSKGKFFINAFKDGLYVFDPKNNFFSRYFEQSNEQFMYSGYVAKNDIVYWSGKNIIFKQDDEYNLEIFYEYMPFKKEKDRMFFQMNEGKNVDEIVFTSEDELYLLDTISGKVTLPYSTQNKISDVGNTVYFDAIYNDSTYLCATFGEGLWSINEDRSNYIILNNLYRNKSLYNIYKDQFNHFWFTTNDGVHRTDSTLSFAYVIDSEHGNLTEIGNQNGFAADKSNWIGFAGKLGFTITNTQYVEEQISKFYPVFVSYFELDKTIHLGIDTAGIELPNESSIARIRLGSVDLYNEQTLVKYRFSELQEWTTINIKDEFIDLSELNEGSYKLQFIQIDKNGFSIEPIKPISVHVYQPIWQKWWFRLLLIMLFTSFISYITFLVFRRSYKRRIRQMELEKKLLEEREELSRDLHDTIGTRLSLIVHHLREGENDPKNLEAAKETAKFSVSYLRQTLWALKEERILFKKFSERIVLVVQKLLEGTGIKLQVQTSYEDHKLIVEPVVSINVTRIVEEAIVNAIKYSQSDKISLAIHSKANTWSIALKDYGVGLDIESKSPNATSYGLSNMRERAEKIGLSLEVDSAPLKGTSIKLVYNGD